VFVKVEHAVAIEAFVRRHARDFAADATFAAFADEKR
jgi:hypothetical protein